MSRESTYEQTTWKKYSCKTQSRKRELNVALKTLQENNQNHENE